MRFNFIKICDCFNQQSFKIWDKNKINGNADSINPILNRRVQIKLSTNIYLQGTIKIKLNYLIETFLNVLKQYI